MPRRKTRYEYIVDEIKKEISLGTLKKDDRILSELELAAKYNVSRITSRRALNELEAEDLIYRQQGSGSFATGVVPNAEGARGDSHRLISLIIPFGANKGRSVDILHGASDFLNARGYYLTVQISENDSAKERAFLQSIESSQMAGYLFYPESDQANIDIIYQLDSIPSPVVTLDKYFEGTLLPSVVSDNFSGARDAVRHLLSLGHKEIGFVSDIGLNDASSVRERYRGYCAALREAGVRPELSNVVVEPIREIRTTHEKTYEDLTEQNSLTPAVRSFFTAMVEPLVRREKPVTAIFCLNDYVAINIMRTLAAMGIRVPEDVSIVGFDNIELSDHIEIPLTTVEQDFFELGKEAARLLIERVEGRGLEPGKRITIPTKLIPRKSTAQCATQSGGRGDGKGGESGS
jgi:GntR family transcriptional regulator of arabinose operon